MAKISVIQNDKTVQMIELARGAVTIGRADDNQVQIADTTISAHHAQIVTYFNASYVEDLGSTNGTFVNGKQVQMHVLKPGDIISIGQHAIKVAEDAMDNSAVA